ncbi:hypothetical protein LI90_4331 (plasmid) [Carbonactinospora thermoautotrophica]|uniref:Uncharacterized protein n=1 Tax=Carbonactinospora thermoautotrophica TaxID=1469144 RepID=A0A132MHV5_9ACTN|nr:hypothetical protein [Carbonactinospora thermoautotrophica]KWW97359.1 hypothetical protein LI90_4331 [Carbonactinospora thermoautotrophica]
MNIDTGYFSDVMGRKPEAEDYGNWCIRIGSNHRVITGAEWQAVEAMLETEFGPVDAELIMWDLETIKAHR